VTEEDDREEEGDKYFHDAIINGKAAAASFPRR
jgi:hypothetical protein